MNAKLKHRPTVPGYLPTPTQKTSAAACATDFPVASLYARYRAECHHSAPSRVVCLRMCACVSCAPRVCVCVSDHAGAQSVESVV